MNIELSFRNVGGPQNGGPINSSAPTGSPQSSAGGKQLGSGDAAAQLLLPLLEKMFGGNGSSAQRNGKSDGGAEGSPLSNLLNKHAGPNAPGSNSGAPNPNGMAGTEQFIQMLNELFQALTGDDSNKDSGNPFAQSNKPSAGGAGPAGGANPTAPSSGGAAPTSPQSMLSSKPSGHEAAPALLDGAGSEALKNTMAPTSDGGAQVNTKSSDMAKTVSGMMDNNTETFGTPAAPNIPSSTAAKGVEESAAKPVTASNGNAKPDGPSLATEKASEMAAVSSGSATGSTEGMEGFAKAAGVKGGAGGETVTVNSVSELKEALSGDDPRIIKLGSDISASEKTDLEFGANKTLVGDGDNNNLHNVYLKSGDSAGNNIFQNLHFTHDAKNNANGDIPLHIDKGEGYWIDHNTFTGTKDQQGADDHSKDKLLYVGGTADNVSLTNSKFENNKYGVILGQPDDSQATADKYAGYPRMTIAHNDFENLSVRAPGLMRHGEFDVYNNHVDDFNLGFTAGTGAKILSEANFFENGRNGGGQASMSGILDDKGSAQFRDINSNVSVQGQTSAETSWKGGPYERNVMSADEAKKFASENAGAQGSGALKFAS